MRNDHKIPKGLIILGLLSAFSGVRAIWNLFYHSAPLVDSLGHASFFLILALGLLLLYRVAFLAFIAFYGYQFVMCVTGIVWPGPSSRAQFVVYTAVKMALLLWLFYYRKFYFKSKDAGSRKHGQVVASGAA